MKLILIRGLPGSGKSTIAKNLCRSMSLNWYEADHYFLNDEGDYIFDATKLRQAHEWCQKQARISLQQDHRTIVSNTFTTKKELKPYFELAKEFGIVPTVIHCENQFGSVHDVPEETMVKMKARWETNLSDLFDMVM